MSSEGNSIIKDGSQKPINRANETTGKTAIIPLTEKIKKFPEWYQFDEWIQKVLLLHEILQDSKCSDCIFCKPQDLGYSIVGECHADPPVVTEIFSGRPEVQLDDPPCMKFIPRV